jgi:proton-translocating NADH-quinone oxidoreductase chain N
MSWPVLVDFIPELIELGTALVVLLGGLFLEPIRLPLGSARRQRGDEATFSGGQTARVFASAVGLAGSVASLISLSFQVSRTGSRLDPLSGTFVLDHYALFLKAILLVFAIVTILLGYRFSEHFRPHQSEFVGLVLIATVGGMFMASAKEMIELYVSLETLSIALYVMVAFNKRDRLSSEAGFKYLVVGAASSAVLLYGLAILYGLTGRTDLNAVERAISAGGVSSPALVLAMIFIIGGFSFKIAAVPFHQWVPDVYQGAPTPVTAFISVSSKAAGYALLIRVLTSALGPQRQQWQIYLAVIAAVTMTVGNISALNQTSLKRLLGYSSIAHAGYIVMGLVAMASQATAVIGLGAILFYIFVYGLTNLAAFGAVQAAEDALGGDEMSLLSGFARRAGGVSMVLALALLSLTGIPPLIGFFAKFFVFLAAVQAGYSWLVLVAVANSALSAVYYLRIVRAMYADAEKVGASTRRVPVGAAMWTALGAGVISILPLAIFANGFVNGAQQAAGAIFSR